jgi:hypothetical protein
VSLEDVQPGQSWKTLPTRSLKTGLYAYEVTWVPRGELSSSTSHVMREHERQPALVAG